MTAGKRAVVCRVAKEEIRHRLRDLCTAHISQMLRDIAAEGRDATRTVGITTIRRIHSCLRSALGDAVKEAWCSTTQPYELARPYSVDRRESGPCLADGRSTVTSGRFGRRSGT